PFICLKKLDHGRPPTSDSQSTTHSPTTRHKRGRSDTAEVQEPLLHRGEASRARARCRVSDPARPALSECIYNCMLSCALRVGRSQERGEPSRARVRFRIWLAHLRWTDPGGRGSPRGLW